MPSLDTHLEALKTGMAAALPARVVTRSYQDFALRQAADLVQGIFTLISLGESDYANYKGREAQLGKLKVALVGQVKVADDSSPVAIEAAEFSMAEDLKLFVQSPPVPPFTGGVLMKGFRQSGQMEHPYGWIAVELEIERDE